MTARTHDLAAFTALVIAFVYVPQVPSISIPTLILAFGANFVGGLIPDIDQPTSDFWDNFRLGPFVAKVVVPALGGHRHISHSFLGIALFALISKFLLYSLAGIVTLNINPEIIWYAFMIGIASHILMDMPTKLGVPLLWPWRFKFGIPPIRALRVESGKFAEKYVFFPGLMLISGYLLYTYQEKVILFLRLVFGSS